MVTCTCRVCTTILLSQGRGTLRSTRRQQLITTEEGADADEEESESVDDDVEPTRRDSLLMTHLTAMWRRHRLCDVILRSEGQKIAAHKLALAAFSETFARRYCEGESAELSQVVVIDVPDSSAGGIQEVLRFVYTGVIRITPDNLAHVLAAAAFLHINEIVNMCKQMLLKPDIETVILFSCLAEKYQLSDNLGSFYDFMCKHFLRVSRTRGWKTLTFGQVFDLLSEDNLSVERELDIFHAAVAWIDADRANRLTFAADLIGCVRFAYITPDEIAKHVETKQFLFQGDEGKELLLCIYRHHALQTCGCQHGQRMHRLPRRKYTPMMAAQDQCNSAYSPPVPASTRQTISRNVPQTLMSSCCDVILSVGGVNPFQPEVEPQARLVEQFHPRENHWTTLTHLPDGRHHHGVAVVEGGIYVIGGSVLDDLNPGHLCNPTTSCYRYDLSTGHWSAVAPLNTPRMYHATAVINDVIFVIAGQTQHSRHLSSMECYRPEVDEWEAGVAMNESRIGVAVAGYRGQLFAVGGFLETQHEHVVRSAVEIFDPGECRWTSRNNLPTPRCHAGLAECVGKLYLVGGSTFPAESPTVCSLPSVLRYDELDDRWDTIQTLQTPRHDMGITVLGCRIFIVGGVSSTENKVLSDVECYDVEGDYWLDDVEPIRCPALGLVCVTVLAS
ncbi:hypothetical protein V1264_021184 [Littorina saxatilis]|uniref:BTB domain-containing protein n=1 Tax=Littorina saxatilis TaxID=31220 RepID=A0AAN9GDP9_9CAEN